MLARETKPASSAETRIEPGSRYERRAYARLIYCEPSFWGTRPIFEDAVMFSYAGPMALHEVAPCANWLCSAQHSCSRRSHFGQRCSPIHRGASHSRDRSHRLSIRIPCFGLTCRWANPLTRSDVPIRSECRSPLGGRGSRPSSKSAKEAGDRYAWRGAARRQLEHFQAKRVRFTVENAWEPKRADSEATESARVASPSFFENSTSPEILLRALTGPNL
jgi:hypothetical protein